MQKNLQIRHPATVVTNCQRYHAPSANEGTHDHPEDQPKFASGFTLVELMVVLAVSAILVVISIPSFQDVLFKSRVLGSVNLFTSSVDLVRSEAIGQNRITAMCRSADPMAANPTCDNTAFGGFAANDWATGWLVYSKPLGVEIPSAFDTATDTIVRRIAPFGGAGNATRLLMLMNPALDFIAVAPAGARISTNASEPMTIVDYRLVSATGTDRAKCISINLLARSAVTPAIAGACP